jgi:hypothetical protein
MDAHRFRPPVGPTKVVTVSDRSKKIVKPAAALGVLATMASVWWFALRPRRKVKLDK